MAPDIAGRKLLFYNVSIGDGFQAAYADNNTVYNSSVCYIKQGEMLGGRSEIGGIVIEMK